MSSDTISSKIWIRFESKKQDGEVIKLRIQDLPLNRMDDLLTFYETYFIKDEAFHKATGIYKNPEAIDEYKKVLSNMYETNPPQIAICCLDNESEDSEEILAISTVQLTSNKMSLDEMLNEIGLELQAEELQAMLRIFIVLAPKFPESVKVKYDNFHEGRGIIVHPDYRGLGIASQIVKQRRLLIKEQKVPITYAWMTSIGTQKAAEKDGWETVAEVTPTELDQLTGLEFGKNVPSYKLMLATEDCRQN